MSLPGVSRHFRIICDCCRTTPKASSRSRPWSSAGVGVVDMLGACVQSAHSSTAPEEIARKRQDHQGVRRNRCDVDRWRTNVRTESARIGGLGGVDYNVLGD